jgi:leader peptidase (prepilin peptidase)/N-methyltransferase
LNSLDLVLLAFSTAFGALLGSYLNVCIWRLPRPGLSVRSPARSHCPGCGGRIAWYDNIPFFSWLVLGGRCRSCGQPISLRYLLVEGLTASLFAVLAWKFLRVDDLRWAEYAFLGTLVAGLIVASMVDVDLRILPNEITVGGMLLLPFVTPLVPGLHTRPADDVVWGGLAWLEGALRSAPELEPVRALPPALVAAVTALVGFAAGTMGWVVYLRYWRTVHPREPKRRRDGALAAVLAGSTAVAGWLYCARPAWILSPPSVSYVSAMVGMAAGAGLVFAVGVAGSVVFRKPAMGFGDVKLMGLLGGATGWVGVLAGFAIACVAGSLVGVWRLVRYRTRYLWFGPFLSFGCFAYLLIPGALRRVLNWYLDLFR